MGVDQNFHIGPYAKCVARGIPLTTMVRFCPTDGSHKQNSQPFCSQCGSPFLEQLQTFPDKIVRSISRGDITNEIDDRLVPCYGLGESFEDYWTSNLHDGCWSASLVMYSSDVIEIDPEIISEGKTKFADFFSKELEVLRKHYQSVEVCWGVLGWCS